MFRRFIHYISNLPLWFFVQSYKTILDVGCGVNSPINYFVRHGQILHGLDISSAEIGKQTKTKYQKVINCDIHDLNEDGKYELITALDFIEHFTKEEGFEILDKIENLAQKRVVVVTPNGFVSQTATADNPWQEHKSGWSVADFRERGYRVYGMFGPKFLRQGTAVLKHHPKLFFGLVSLILYPVYFWLPGKSFSLLAVYDKKYDR